MTQYQVQTNYDFNLRNIFHSMTEFQNPYNDGFQRCTHMADINNIFIIMSKTEQENIIIAMADRFRCLVAPDEVEEYLTRYGLLGEIAKPFATLYKNIAQQNLRGMTKIDISTWPPVVNPAFNMLPY